MTFVGREAELAELARHLSVVRRTCEGVFLAVRGRRQVGKSALVEELVRRARVPYAYFSATSGALPANELTALATELAASSLADASVFGSVRFETFESALRLVASRIEKPSILVIDELPYLCRGEPSLEGTLQKVWDRHLSRVPILLIAVGSDLSMMEALGEHGRPLYGRVRELYVGPLTVSEVATLLGQRAPEAFDAYLAIGGFPALAREWGPRQTLDRFLHEQLASATSPLIVVGERILGGELPAPLQARTVLEAIGSGETTFEHIRSRAGVNEGSLLRSLRTLVEQKRVVSVERPLSAAPSRLSRYLVADPYLRFWLSFIGPAMDLLLRGRGDLVAANIRGRWGDFRGRAIEPLVRASIERLLDDDPRFAGARHVGSYWTRDNRIELDLVGAEKPRAPSPLRFIGSIKWRERTPFGRDDLSELTARRSQIPGGDKARLVAVSRSGFRNVSGLDVALGPDDLLAAWSPRS